MPDDETLDSIDTATVAMPTWDDGGPRTQIYGLRTRDDVPHDLVVAIAEHIDDVTPFDPDDIVTVKPAVTDQYPFEDPTPLRAGNPMVQFGPEADAEFTDDVDIDGGGIGPDGTVYIALDKLEADTDQLDGDPTHVVVDTIAYNVEIAAGRADGHINQAIPELDLQRWDVHEQTNIEIPPDSEDQTESEQLIWDDDHERCPVCGSQWIKRTVTYRPRTVGEDCAVCGYTYHWGRP